VELLVQLLARIVVHKERRRQFADVLLEYAGDFLQIARRLFKVGYKA
jgi:hypothetical protein